MTSALTSMDHRALAPSLGVRGCSKAVWGVFVSFSESQHFSKIASSVCCWER